MKSKTSCFNRTLFKKNFTHYWPLWALHLAYLLLAMPFQLWQRTTTQWFIESRVSDPGIVFDAVRGVMAVQMEPVSTFLIAVVIAMTVFSYLYSAKNANMIHALPVNRLELFVTNYLSGWGFLLIPQMIAFLLTVLVALGSQITDIQYLFTGMLIQAGVSFFAYSLAVFVAMFTGQMLAMPIYFVIVNFLYVGGLALVSGVVELLQYGISNAWNPGKSCILSPLYYLVRNLHVRPVYAEGTYDITGLEILGVNLVGIYAAAGVLFTIGAYRLYRRRQLETAGDWISIGIVKPIFRWGVALCGGVTFALVFTSVLMENRNIDRYVSLMACVAVMGFVGFFAAEMLLQKSFRVFRKKRIFEWAGFTVAALIFITLFQVDVFGVERRVPAVDEIEAAFVNMDFPMQIEGEDMETLLALHRRAIADKETYLAAREAGEAYYSVTFRYYLKDGGMLERNYPLPISRAYVEDQTTPTGQIVTWELEADRLKQMLLGRDYGHNQYMTGHIDLYDDELLQKDYSFGREELARVVAALERDIEAGNYGKYYVWTTHQGEIERYYNNVYFDYYSRSGVPDTVNYYYNYREYTDPGMRKNREMASGAGVSISFGPECVHLVNTLKDLGVVDDTWKLWTQSEYE